MVDVQHARRHRAKLLFYTHAGTVTFALMSVAYVLCTFVCYVCERYCLSSNVCPQLLYALNCLPSTVHISPSCATCAKGTYSL